MKKTSWRDLVYVDMSDLPCTEIDFIEDMEKANELAGSSWFFDEPQPLVESG